MTMQRAIDITAGIVATLAVGVAVAGTALATQPTPAEQTVTNYGFTIVWVDNLTCDGEEAWGCFDIAHPDQIQISTAQMTPDEQEYVILHELGHAVHYRFGDQSTECEADAFAISLGATSFRTDC